MADPVVTITPTHVSVPPGGQARISVAITNPGQIVEGYAVEVIDELDGAGPAAYAQVIAGENPDAPTQPGSPVRPTVSVYPQQKTEVVIVFTPGSGPEVPGGTFVYGVRVTSTVDPAIRAVAEAELEVGQVHGLTAKLIPVTSSGRWQGRHVVEISNWGNSAARLKLTAADPDQALGYLVRPDVVDVPLGGTATARVHVRTKSPRLRGQPSRLPFTVTCEPDPPTSRPDGPPGLPDPGRPMADGAFNQKPILSKGVVAVATLAVVGLIAGGVYAFTRPSGGGPGGSTAIPATPRLDPVTVTGPNELGLRWSAVADVTGYELWQLADGSDAPVDALTLGSDIRARQIKDLRPAQEYCFQLLSVRDKVKSPPSEKACAVTAAVDDATGSPTTEPSGSGSPTESAGAGGGGAEGGAGGGAGGGGGSPTSGTGGNGGTATDFPKGAWLALVYVRPSNAPGAEDGLLQLQSALAAKNVTTRLVKSTDYPNLAPKLQQPSLALAIDQTFDTRENATDTCKPLRDDQAPLEDCLIVQPNP